MAGQQMQLEDWLDDLCVRFIINLPQEDLSSVERICFQVEEAQWFYEDFIRPLDPSLPSMTLRTFCLRIFQHCPLLAAFSVENHMAAFDVFLQYKTRIPVRGAILLNHDMDSVVLVKGWKKGANWSFPRGKINKDEDDLDCAVREVFEETGMDLRAHGLVPTTGKPKYIEISMREQQLRLYVFRDVPMDYNFQPQTRKEISKIQWYKLSELPTFRKKNAQNQNEPAAGANKFYMVAPFLVPLKKWVTGQKRQEEKRMASMQYHSAHAQFSVDEGHTEDETYATDHGANYLQQPTSVASLDGATKELQRLLKMQPPTAGVQPALTQEDKGSALLSILQASKPAAPAHAPQAAPIPHTPQDHTIIPPQPQNPHHHNNQNQHAVQFNGQLPPSFPLPHGAGNVPLQQQHQYAAQPPPPQGYPGAPLHQPQKSIPLVHPQPLPPQVQRAMFNNSAFQENGANQHHPGHVQAQQQQPQQQQQYAQGVRGPQQPGQPPVPLTGQSMALLSAFKREPSETQQPPQQQQQQPHMGQTPTMASAGPAGPAGQNIPPPPPYSQYPAQQQQQQQQQQQHQAGPHQSMPPQSQYQLQVMPQQHQHQQPLPPQQQPGGGMRNQGPPADPHRNALLGMFKKAEAQSPAAQPPQPVQAPPAPTYIPELSSPSQRKPSSDAPVELGIDNLSIQPGKAAQYPGQQPSPAQRSNSLAARSSVSSPYAPHTAQPHQPSPLQQHVAPAPAPGGGGDQKRQLLSLFGNKQPAPPQLQARSPLGGAGNTTIHELGNGNPASRDVSRSRIASLAASASGDPSSGDASRRGSQTPISPADESFLLGYLQSVTNNVSR